MPMLAGMGMGTQLRRRLGAPMAAEDPDPLPPVSQSKYEDGGNDVDFLDGRGGGFRSTPSSPAPSQPAQREPEPESESVFSTGRRPTMGQGVQSNRDARYDLPDEAYSRAQEELSRPTPVLRPPSWKKELLGALIDTAGVIGTGFGVPLSVSQRASSRIRYGDQPDAIEQQEGDLNRALKGADLERGMRTTQARMEMTREATKSREQVAREQADARRGVANINAGAAAKKEDNKFQLNSNMRQLKEGEEPDSTKGESLYEREMADGTTIRFAKMGTEGQAKAKSNAKVEAESVPVPSWLKDQFPGRDKITSREMYNANQVYQTKMKESGANTRASISESGKSVRHSENRSDRKSKERDLNNAYARELQLRDQLAEIEKISATTSTPGTKNEYLEKLKADLELTQKDIVANRERIRQEVEAESQNARGDGTGSTVKTPAASPSSTKSKSTPAPAASPSTSLPPEAAARLKEGVVTKFSNGQKWTKKNGAPVQVP